MPTSKIPLVPGTKTLARGSVVIGNASGEPSALAIGSNTYVLKSDGTDISWGADAAGTITAFTNGVDNRVVTATSATALNGESALTFSSPTLKNTTASSGATASGESDELVLEGTAEVGMSILSATSGSGSVFFGDSGANGQGRLVYYHGDDSMRFVTNSSEGMRVNSSGDVSIGSTATTAKFNVATTGGSGYFHNTGASFGANNLQSAVNRFTADNSYRFFYCVNSDNVKMQVIDSGAVQNAPNSYGGISDERTKQDITDASSQWEDIKALKVRKYKLKCDVALDGENAQSQIGVVSQELEASGMSGLVLESDSTAQDVKLHSDFGSIDEKGVFTQGQKVKAVKYSVLYMKAIKALQESMERIEQLEAKVTALESA